MPELNKEIQFESVAYPGHSDRSSTSLSCPLVPLSHLDRLLVATQPGGCRRFAIGLTVLSVSFIVAALLGFRFSNWLVAFIYQIAAVWLGLLNFLFVAACLCWIADFVLRFALPGCGPPPRPSLDRCPFSLARPFLAAVYGILNARWIRVRRVPVKLAKSARIMARPHGAPDQRPAPRQHQRRTLRAAHRGHGAAPETRHHLHPRRPLRRHQSRSRQAGSASLRALATFRHLLRFGQSRGVRWVEATTLRRSGTPVFACWITSGLTIDGLQVVGVPVHRLELSHAACGYFLTA